MKPTEPATLLTIGQIAARLGVPTHRVDYAVRTYSIKPIARAGILRVFSEDQIGRIAAAVRRCESRPASRELPR